eukprot:TRINITY_DN5373_c0_g1_i1.p1 TRINITY_DN5373_c0_g1~~TRINITY_DN5373_c0_g1_i1.p1  ORF type:complete len:266 (-),score=79.87 TRINITY_DN5373_c0_g1_i1:54-827(-)
MKAVAVLLATLLLSSLFISSYADIVVHYSDEEKEQFAHMEEIEIYDNFESKFFEGLRAEHATYELGGGVIYKKIYRSGIKEDLERPTTNETLVTYHLHMFTPFPEDDELYQTKVKHRLEPFTRQLKDLLPGLIEGVGLMKPGDEWQFFIPWRMGFGEEGIPHFVEPYRTLIAVVHVLELDGELGAEGHNGREYFYGQRDDEEIVIKEDGSVVVRTVNEDGEFVERPLTRENEDGERVPLNARDLKKDDDSEENKGEL